MNDLQIFFCFIRTSNYYQENSDVIKEVFDIYMIDIQINDHQFFFHFKNLFILCRFGIMSSADEAEDIIEQADTNRDGKYELRI